MKNSKGKNALKRLPKDFHWQVLTRLLRDCETCNLTYDLTELREAIRKRDVAKYVAFSKKCGLSADFPGSAGVIAQDFTLQDLRWIRLLGCFKKFDFPDSPFDKKLTAFKKFKKAEASCKRVNESHIWDEFQNVTPLDRVSWETTYLYPVMRRAQSFIARLLGPCDFEHIYDCAYHGPGATSMRKGDDSIPIEKFSAPIDVTTEAREYLEYAILTHIPWLRALTSDFKKSHGTTDSLLELGCRFDDVLKWAIKECNVSRQLFVPKDSEQCRGIQAEPTGNIYLQLGVGKVISNRLKHFGFDISTQEKNQKLAYYGSLTNEVVTLDLSLASDSIPLSILKLFPADWADCLRALRTPVGFSKDFNEAITFEKLSAMGNGYTFPIETLVFASLLVAVIEEAGFHYKEFINHLAVYGDDIILPARFYSDYAMVLRHLGFKANKDKTFADGPIRESCGCDYYNGFDISVPTIKSNPELQYEFHVLYNTFFNVSKKYGLYLCETLDYIRSYVKRPLWGPPTEEETGWFFLSRPDRAVDHLHEKAVDWQTPVYKLKKLIVDRPTKKHCRLFHDEYYLPLLHYENVRSLGGGWPHGLPTEPLDIASTYGYTKLHYRQYITTVVIPYYLWN